MTAVDAAVQSKLLGAEQVTLVYRRGPRRPCRLPPVDEQRWALQTNGVVIRHWLAPQALAVEAKQRPAAWA